MKHLEKIKEAIDEMDEWMIINKGVLDPGYLRNALILWDFLELITDGMFLQGIGDDVPAEDDDTVTFLELALEHCNVVASDLRKVLDDWKAER